MQTLSQIEQEIERRTNDKTINVHPFSTNVLDLVGKPLKASSDGRTVTVSRPMSDFVVCVDGREVCRTQDNIQASACLNGIGVQYADVPVMSEHDKRTLKKLIDGGRAIVSYTFIGAAEKTDYGSEIRTCFNRNRLGVHDAYVAWIHDSAKPADLEVFPTYAVGSL